MIYIDVRNLVYHHLQPFAKAACCQMFIADNATHKSWMNSLEKKVKSLKLAKDELTGLYDALETYGCIAILKSKKYLGAPEIAPFFSKVGLDAEDIHYMNSSNAEKYKTWGDFDASIPPEKRAFLYWFAIKLQAGAGGAVFEI